MNLKDLSDSQLLSQIRLDAENERRSGLAVIHQLRDIKRRRLYARLGYSSLFVYCTEELKYSPGSASRRIQAMEALQDLPEIEARIEKGELTLANVSQVQFFCEKEKKTTEEKRELLNAVCGLSKRAAERKLAEIAPQPERPEKVRAITEEKTELRITLNAETLHQLDRVRDRIAHARPGASYAEVIQYLAELGLKKLDPAAPKREYRKSAPREDGSTPITRQFTPPADVAKQQRAKHSRPHIPAPIRRQVWQRDLGRCTFINKEGKRCDSSAFLQLDHIQPKALGGSDQAENLRLRCQAHNLLAAIDVYGKGKMSAYLDNR